MSFQRWNRVTAVGAVIFMIGFSLMVFRYPFGGIVLVGGAVASIAGMIGTFRHLVKHPPHCPYCRKSLLTASGRTKGGSTVTCPHCGRQVNLVELYHEKKL